nr:RNA-directed DNA polymerase, eukaryota [Tanacetum cinerariifolium]
GGNASFIALIPKMQDARVAKDFRPISLIGSVYKIIAKILANRLVGVLGDLIHEVQFAFIANRQILDGSFILDELIHWCRSKKKQVMIFKVDFEKAYDSVRWDYLDDVLKKFGFDMSKGISASGLHMNLHKRKLMGIFVKDEVVFRALIKMGCSTLKTPFTYLGIKVGGSMARIRSWDEIVDKVKSRLSKWKKNALSIGGCEAYVKRGLADKLHQRSVKCIFVGYPKETMGYYFYFPPENKVIVARNTSEIPVESKSLGSPPKLIPVGNGINTSFWEEIWRGDMNFKTKFPRLYALESDKKITVASKINHNDVGLSLRRPPRDGVELVQFNSLNVFLTGTMLSDSNDRWSLVGSGEFLVASVRKLIDEHRLGGYSHKTRWIHTVPIKINILAWKVWYDFLPTRLNLSHRGIAIQSIICPSCNKEVESTNHIFFACSLVRNIYRKITSWWEFPYVEFDSYESWLEWLLSLRMSSRHKNIMEGIFYVTWWLVWNH